MTYDEFYNRVEQLPEEVENRDLETYLLALYGLLTECKDNPFSVILCLDLLKKAFTATPVPYDEQWGIVRKMPDEKGNGMSSFAYTQAVIVFQIAELHRMRDKELQDELRYFGITSETGYDWYNFDPITLLRCGADGLYAHNGEGVTIPDDWRFLAELLDLGRYYE